jgi:uncharacterized protein (TIGR03437 family)
MISTNALSTAACRFKVALPRTCTFPFLICALSRVISAQVTSSNVTLQTSANPTNYGSTLTLTAIVSPTGATGTVTWYDGVVVLGSAKLNAGEASMTTALLGSGQRSIRARYSGDSSHQSSVSGVLTQVVSVLAQRGLSSPLSVGSVHTPGPCVIGDFNRDGHLDVAIISTLNNAVSVMLGNGNGTFQPPVSYPVGSLPLSLAVGDFNGDGVLDLAVANQSSGSISVLVGTGSGTFQSAVAYPAGPGPTAVVVADFNNDGVADLAVSNLSNAISVILGKGDGTFLAPTSFPASSPLLLATGDFNGDGFVDLAVPNSNSKSVSIYLGKGDGTLKPAVQYPVGSQPAAVAVNDFNADGFSDLAVVNYTDGSVSILLGNGDGTFKPAAIYSVGSAPDFVVVEDFNSDGIPDLVVTNADGNPSLLTGKGDGTFLAANQLGSGHSNVPIAVGDLNGDGRPDLVVPDYATDNVSVLLGFPVTPNLMITMSHVGNFVQGQTGATYTISVINVGHYATWGQVLVKDTLPTGLAVGAMTGAGWICTVTTVVCSRSDVLAVGGSYPPISVGVNVAADALASVVNTATVSGGSAPNNSASDTTAVNSNTLTIVTGQALPSAQVGSSYSQTLAATGGTPPYVWSIVAGSLPGGLNLSASGIISGTPTTTGQTTFSVQVKDSGTLSAAAALSLTVSSTVPVLVSGGVLNAASFSKDSSGNGATVAPGSLVTIYGSFPGATAASSQGVPYVTSLGGVTISFGGILAPLKDVVPDGPLPFVNAQVPYDVTGPVQVIATVNGAPSVPISIPTSASAPGIFTIPPTGQGYAVLLFTDPTDNTVKIAAPTAASASIGISAAPITRGQSGFFYATGLGQKTPPVSAGDGGGNGVHDAVQTPLVTIGGVPAQVLYAGQAPGFPGVDQINVMIPPNAPTGDAVALVVTSADHSVVSNVGQIAVR